MFYFAFKFEQNGNCESLRCLNYVKKRENLQLQLYAHCIENLKNIHRIWYQIVTMYCILNSDYNVIVYSLLYKLILVQECQ